MYISREVAKALPFELFCASGALSRGRALRGDLINTSVCRLLSAVQFLSDVIGLFAIYLVFRASPASKLAAPGAFASLFFLGVGPSLADRKRHRRSNVQSALCFSLRLLYSLEATVHE